FEAVQTEGAAAVAQAASAPGAPLLHVSALGASDQSTSSYARSKAEGEERVRRAYPGATIFRPSVVFGPEDDFFNRFGALARLSPVLPLIGGGRTRFQPVYAGDVARAASRALSDRETASKTFEL